MLKKNCAKNIHIASTRIITTHKLPKDFFPTLKRPSKSLETRRQNSQNCENIHLESENINDGLLFTFYRSKISKLKENPVKQVQQQKYAKKRQSCPVMPNLEEIISKTDKQNGVLQKKGRCMFKICRRTQNLGRNNTNQLPFGSLKQQ